MRHRVKEVNIQKDITIQLRFDGGAWANMTFQYFKENDWWNVTITSDWGNWSHGWSRSGMGKDIYSFMAEGADKSYLRSKLIGNEPKLFNAQKSAKLVRREIREELNYWDDRERFEYLINLTKELESHENPDYFVEELWKNDEMREILGDEYRCYWNYTVMERHPRTKYFFDKIFPKFFKHIKKIAKETSENTLHKRHA